MTRKSSSPDFDPVLYVRKPNACLSALASDELDCDSAGASSGSPPAHLLLKNQQPGTYFVFVDGYVDSAGAFSLDVSLSAPTLPPSNDSCTSPCRNIRHSIFKRRVLVSLTIRKIPSRS